MLRPRSPLFSPPFLMASSWTLRRCCYCYSTAIQTTDHRNSAMGNPVFSFLPETQNPSNIVGFICASLKQKDASNWNSLQEQGMFAKFSSRDLSTILLRCQSDSLANLGFFNWVRDHLGTEPNLQNCCIMIHNLVWSKNFKQGMKILFDLVHQNEEGMNVFEGLLLCTKKCNWDPVVFEMLIKVYLRIDRVKEGFEAFRNMAKLGFIPSVPVVNCLLNGLAKMGCCRKCWWIYEHMWRFGLQPNSFTFNILAYMLCKEGNVDKVNTFLERAEEQGFYPDIVTYNMLAHQYCKVGRLKDAIHLYNIMWKRDVEPDLVTYTTLIHCLCNGGSIREARNLFDLMVRRGLQPDIVAYNTLMHGYCKEGMMQEARSLVFDMIACHVFPDNFTCRILINGYHGINRMITAMNLVLEFTRLGIRISEETYCYMIIALCKDGRPFAAKSLFEQMPRPDKRIYSEMIEALCRGNHVKEAMDLKAEMVNLRSMKGDISTYTSLIRSFCKLRRSNEAMSLMQEMVESGLPLNVETCRGLLNVHCETKNVADAERVLRFYVEKAGIFDSECYNAVTRAVVQECDFSELMKFQVRMGKLGFLPNGVTCSYAVQGIRKAMGPKILDN